MFLHVIKNESGEWFINRYISSPINVFGVVSQITFGDISKLPLETRKLEGFWTQEDLYEGMVEYTVFDHKDVEWDEENAVLRNKYVYVQMPIADIQRDFQQRVISERDQRGIQGYSYEEHQYITDSLFRSTNALYLSLLAMDESSLPEDFSIEDTSGQAVTFTSTTFKAMCSDYATYNTELYKKCRELQANISKATTLEDVKTAATWE